MGTTWIQDFSGEEIACPKDDDVLDVQYFI